MFRVSTTLIIRSTQNCKYSLRYWPRWREIAAEKKIWPLPEAVFTVLCTPDDECGWHPKHVEWTCRIINGLLCVASRFTVINKEKARSNGRITGTKSVVVWRNLYESRTRLAHERDMSAEWVRSATKLSHLHLYKTTVVKLDERIMKQNRNCKNCTCRGCMMEKHTPQSSCSATRLAFISVDPLNFGVTINVLQ